MQNQILLVPVLAAPTKPLSPSHVKVMIWMDMLFKLNDYVNSVTILDQRLHRDSINQVIDFWHYIDLNYSNIEYKNKLSAEYVGNLYVESHKNNFTVPIQITKEYREKIEKENYIHPISKTILRQWKSEFEFLNISQKFLDTPELIKFSIEETIKFLKNYGLLLDQSNIGGSIFLDMTDEGLPLRQIISNDGNYNYLFLILRELLPQLNKIEKILLAYDIPSEQDYILINKILKRLGKNVIKFPVSRMYIEGESKSSRHGGWEDYTLAKILDKLTQKFNKSEIRFGMKLYFIHEAKQKGKCEFNFENLEQMIMKASDLINQIQFNSRISDKKVIKVLRQKASKSFYVDPAMTLNYIFRKDRDQKIVDKIIQKFFI